MLWGFFKKIIVADRLGEFVDTVYKNPAPAPRAMVFLATYLFAFQIYLDFSGYTDIARGTARLLGIRLMENFNRPYGAQSITDFWRRWHISLSSWFRDYVYIPLGGSLGSRSRTVFNLLIVFLLSGLWHGANITFVVWGLYHGLLVVLYRLSAPGRERAAAWCQLCGIEFLWKALSWFITFHAVCLGWVFFRARSIKDALSLLKPSAAAGVTDIPQSIFPWIIRAGLILLVVLYESGTPESGNESRVSQWSVRTRWACYYGMTILLVFYGKWGGRQFIYFQF
jgi:D-alanyl-lipoteichoic acid acyltransferase DltB (MBOAT superfamily)